MSVKEALGVKTDDQVHAEIEAEPTIKDARAALGLADRILAAIDLRARRRRGPEGRKADAAEQAAADARVLGGYEKANGARSRGEL